MAWKHTLGPKKGLPGAPCLRPEEGSLCSAPEVTASRHKHCSPKWQCRHAMLSMQCHIWMTLSHWGCLRPAASWPTGREQTPEIGGSLHPWWRNCSPRPKTTWKICLKRLPFDAGERLRKSDARFSSTNKRDCVYQIFRAHRRGRF